MRMNAANLISCHLERLPGQIRLEPELAHHRPGPLRVVRQVPASGWRGVAPGSHEVPCRLRCAPSPSAIERTRSPARQRRAASSLWALVTSARGIEPRSWGVLPPDHLSTVPTLAPTKSPAFRSVMLRARLSRAFPTSSVSYTCGLPPVYLRHPRFCPHSLENEE